MTESGTEVQSLIRVANWNRPGAHASRFQARFSTFSRSETDQQVLRISNEFWKFKFFQVVIAWGSEVK